MWDRRWNLPNGLILMLALLAPAPVHAREWREIKDPHFGAALFEFFQENYFSALTGLMTAQHFERLPHHADEAELLRGGMLLSYGLHREAGRIFETLIDAGAPGPVRDRAWFYIAKIRYQRGYVAEAEDAIGRVRDPLPGDLEDERRMLHAFLLLRRQQYAEAVAMLRRAPLRSDWALYGQYNLGVALVQAGERAAGVKLLEDVGRNRARGEEFRALSDKANVALAFTYLQGDSPAWAIPHLERVRLNGLLSNKALLGMGWAHTALQDYTRALVPWTELAARPASDLAVQESLLAVSFAFGKLGAYRQSLERYQQALDIYTQEFARLDEAEKAIRAGAMVETIMRQNPGEESGWFWRVQLLSDTPETRYLAELLAGHDFQEGLKNYRDLRFLEKNLDGWSRNVDSFHDMLATRRQAYAERLPKVLAGERALHFERLRLEQAAASQELERIARENDAAALATDKERALLTRLERVGAALDRVGDVEEREQAREKYRRLRGVLAWDLSTSYNDRLRQAQKATQEAGRAVAQAEARRQVLTAAQAEAPASFDAFERRIEAMRGRIRALRGDIDAAARGQEQLLSELALAELERRREQIGSYVTQARFAVAQIYDQAVRASDKAP